MGGPCLEGQCHCGCCEGDARLPLARDNVPGKPAVGYRVGTHGSFKAAMLARLSNEQYPALAGLRTRRDDDFTIATCDAAAMLLDVLTFYQERYANEFYLRSATERRSVVELARLIGYQPAPGVAAGTRLAFLLEEAPGAPQLAAEPVMIPIGTRVQSVPGPGEDPQTFETVEAITARVEWNAIPVQTSEPQTFAIGITELFVSGVSAQLQSGDVILIVGDERLEISTQSTRWDARVVKVVERDNARGVTRVTLADGLGQSNPQIVPAAKNPRMYVFRQRVGLFGHNAPDPLLLFRGVNIPLGLTIADAGEEWSDYKIQTTIDLDNSYPKVLPGSWVVLAGGTGPPGLPSLPGRVELYLVDEVRHLTRSDYALSSRITRIEPDKQTNLSTFSLDGTIALAQTEELPIAERPLFYPLYGTEVALGRLSPDLAPTQAVGIVGRRQRVRIVVEKPIKFKPDAGGEEPVKPNDSFILAGPPVKIVGVDPVAVAPANLPGEMKKSSVTLRWTLLAHNGDLGTLDAPGPDVQFEDAHDDDPVVRELGVIADSDTAVVHNKRTTLQLETPLLHVYDRKFTTICANIARATDGETVSEIAGSGNAAIGGQSFVLKQSPLTYVSAATTDGRASTLEVRVNGLLWNEVPTLFEQDPRAHVYALRQDGDSHTIVQFGDAVEGARLPSSQDNVRFIYRKFLGSGGNLDAGRLTTLLGRPLGVKSVSNITAASGGEDAETIDAARTNAPLTMLTLGRAVSLQDYTDFARSFAGIARALAAWLGTGTARTVFVTVAGPEGAAVTADSDTRQNLVKALRDYGDALVLLRVESYAPVAFRIEGRIKVAPGAVQDDVIAAVEAALRARYGFDARDFGQIVSLDEVMAVIHSVTGVEGADIDALYRVEPNAASDLNERLFAMPAHLNTSGIAIPAELLTLDPAPLQFGVMP